VPLPSVWSWTPSLAVILTDEEAGVAEVPLARALRPIGRIGAAALTCALALACDGDVATAPVMEPATKLTINQWDLTGGDRLVYALTASSPDAPQTCEGGINEYGHAWIWCSCPATMHFDGSGGCECDNGGSGIDCDLSGDDSTSPDGGDPDADPDGTGSDPEPEPDPHDPEDDELRLELACPSQTTFGSSATCTLQNVQTSDQLSNIRWKFMSFYLDNTPQKSGGTSWNGDMVASGTVVLEFDFNGEPQSLQ